MLVCISFYSKLVPMIGDMTMELLRTFYGLYNRNYILMWVGVLWVCLENGIFLQMY